MYRFNLASAPHTSPEQEPEQVDRSTKPGGISWTKALAISALPLALLFGAAFQSPNSVPAQLQAIESQLSALQAQLTSLANKGPRKFYLTQTKHNGAQALSACAPGYHMASLWEINEPSNVRYDTDLGLTVGDAGFGPPDGSGWVRTGFITNSFSSVAGFTNCNAWLSADAAHLGSLVTLDAGWNLPGTTASPWRGSVSSCSEPANVWCVQD